MSFRPTPFDVVVHEEGARVRLALKGELDVATAPRLERELERLRGTPVLLDLDELEFIDSSGLRLILETVVEAREDAWEVEVTEGSPEVRRLIEMTGTRPLLDGRA